MSSSTDGNCLPAESGGKVEYITSNFQLHKFTAEIGERKLVLQVLRMTDSILIFINDKKNLQMTSLALALSNRYDNSPIGTRLLGSFTDEASKNIACRVTKRLNKTVFVSCNVEDDQMLLPLIEKRLYEEIKNKPNAF